MRNSKRSLIRGPSFACLLSVCGAASVLILAILILADATHAAEEDSTGRDCLKYLPEIGRSVRVRCSDEAPPAEQKQPVEPAPQAATPKEAQFAPLTLDQERALKPGMTFKECADCPEMVVIPAGTFVLGSPTSESPRGMMKARRPISPSLARSR